MNQIIIEEQDFIDNSRVILSGRRKDHIISILKSEVGDTINVGLLNDKQGTGTITNIENNLIFIDTTLHDYPPPPLPASLILALPRPKMLKRVLQCATVMGIKKIALIRTWKVDKSYWQSPLLQPENLKEQLILGLEQARDTILPEITLHTLFKPFVEDKLESFCSGATSLVAHPGSAEPCPSGITEPVTLAIGPEGGFIPYEIDMLTNRGFTAVSIGRRILRVDQAVPAILGRLFPL